MTTHRSTISPECSDAELVSRSLAGDREAFGGIVQRYQTLICSLAYSRIGNLGQSEDVAQETFLTAWKHLCRLREPAKLRAWLCGIVRHRIHKCRHQEQREPVHHAESLDLVHDLSAGGALPSDHAVRREEEALLWRSLESIPETYREPLVLFYRHHQSIASVAAALALSEDAVKQRLSRGRKLLQAEVQSFVENTLSRTAPGREFSHSVLTALPAGPATFAGAAWAGKGATAAKSGVLAAWLAPVMGILGGLAAHGLIVRSAPTARERRLKGMAFAALWVFVLAWCTAGQLALRALSHRLGWSAGTFVGAMAGFWWIYAMVLSTLGLVIFRRVEALREESDATPGGFDAVRRPHAVGVAIAIAAGVHLACFGWLLALARQAHDPAAAGAIAAAALALAVWNVLRLRGKSGAAATRAVACHLAVVWGVILLILNVRLDAWATRLHGLDLAAWRQLLPAWVTPLLSVSIAAWIILLFHLTRRRRSFRSA